MCCVTGLKFIHHSLSAISACECSLDVSWKAIPLANRIHMGRLLKHDENPLTTNGVCAGWYSAHPLVVTKNNCLANRRTMRSAERRTWKVFTVSVPLLFVFYQFLFLALFYSMFSVLWLAHLHTNTTQHNTTRSAHHHSKRSSIVFDRDHFIANRNNSLFNNKKKMITKIPSEQVSLACVSSSSSCCKHTFSRLNYRSECLKQSKKEKMMNKKWKKNGKQVKWRAIYQWMLSSMTLMKIL